MDEHDGFMLRVNNMIDHGARTLRWLGLGLGAVLLVVGTHFVWPRGGGPSFSLPTGPYGWRERPGPHSPNVPAALYEPQKSHKRAPLVVFLQGNEPSLPDDR